MQTMRNWREYLVLIRKPKFHPDILQESKEVRHLILHHITKLFKLVDLEEYFELRIKTIYLKYMYTLLC